MTRERIHGIDKQPGFALIAVLVALSILLALVAPFMAAMLHEANISTEEEASAKVRVDVDGLREWLLFKLTHTDLSIDRTPFSDDRSEFVVGPFPEAFTKDSLRAITSERHAQIA